jgi:hypothetical protein
MTYRVRGWKEHFETYESGRLKKALPWVAMPTKHDGKTFRRVMRLDPSGALYGTWALILQVAAKCPIRGTLADADGPLTAVDIADKTDLSEEAVAKALEVFSSNEIRWLETVSESESAGTPAEMRELPQNCGDARLPDRTEPNRTRTGQDTTKQNPTEPDKTSGSGFYGKVTLKTLQSVGLLLDWLKTTDLPSDDRDFQIKVIALAVRATTEKNIKNRPALFVQLLKARDWPKITDVQHDEAKRRFRTWQDEQRAPGQTSDLMAPDDPEAERDRQTAALKAKFSARDGPSAADRRST